MTAGDLDYVGFYDKPLLKFERLLETVPGVAPGGLALVRDSDAASGCATSSITRRLS